MPMAQVYAGGEACDITGKLRETEVHFVCSEESKAGIKSIREHATCQYTMVFATPELCKHPGFQMPKQPVHTIVCSRPGGTQQAEGTVLEQPQEMEQEAEGMRNAAPFLPITSKLSSQHVSFARACFAQGHTFVDMPGTILSPCHNSFVPRLMHRQTGAEPFP